MADELIPLSQPYITDQDKRAVLEVLESSQLSFGPKTDAFEQRFAELVGAKYAVAVNSGTSALHLAVKSLGIAEGDEVIVSPFSFIASVNCLLYENVAPVFVDIEEQTLGLDPKLVEQRISGATRGILPTYVFGQACQMDLLSDIARRHSLKILIDSCEAIGAMHHEQGVLKYADAAAYGFYPNKQMTTGEGGMLVMDEEKIYRLVRSLRNQGRGDSMEWLVHDRLGYNYRMSELTAALGLSQVLQMEVIKEQREKLAAYYLDSLADIPEITLPYILEGNVHSWFVFAIRVSSDIRDELLKKLNAKGVQSKVYFYPCIHLQPFYRDRFGFKEGMFPIAEKVGKETIVLPFFTAMTHHQVEMVKQRLQASLLEITRGV